MAKPKTAAACIQDTAYTYRLNGVRSMLTAGFIIIMYTYTLGCQLKALVNTQEETALSSLYYAYSAYRLQLTYTYDNRLTQPSVPKP